MNAPIPRQRRLRRRPSALALVAVLLPQASPAAPKAPTPSTPAPTPPAPLVRRQSVLPLSGGLDGVPLLNDNNPELITAPGILFSSFDPSRGLGSPLARGVRGVDAAEFLHGRSLLGPGH